MVSRVSIRDSGAVWSFRTQGEVLLKAPRGSIYTTIMESGPKNHDGDGLLGPNSRSILVAYIGSCQNYGTFWVP